MKRKSTSILILVLVLIMALTFTLTACSNPDEGGSDINTNTDTEITPERTEIITKEEFETVDTFYARLEELLSNNNYTMDICSDDVVDERYKINETAIYEKSENGYDTYTINNNGKIRDLVKLNDKWYYVDKERDFNDLITERRANEKYRFLYKKEASTKNEKHFIGGGNPRDELNFTIAYHGRENQEFFVTRDKTSITFVTHLEGEVFTRIKIYDINSTKIDIPTIEGKLLNPEERYIKITPTTTKFFEGVNTTKALPVMIKLRELLNNKNFKAEGKNQDGRLYNVCTPDMVRRVWYTTWGLWDEIDVKTNLPDKIYYKKEDDGTWTKGTSRDPWSTSYRLKFVSEIFFDKITSETTYNELVSNETYDEQTKTITCVLNKQKDKDVTLLITVSDDLRSVKIVEKIASANSKITNQYIFSNFGECAVILPEEVNGL